MKNFIKVMDKALYCIELKRKELGYNPIETEENGLQAIKLLTDLEFGNIEYNQTNKDKIIEYIARSIDATWNK